MDMKNIKWTKNKVISLLVPVLFLAFGIWILSEATGMLFGFIKVGRGMRGDDAPFPTMVAWLIIVISIVDFIVELRKDNQKNRFANVNFLALLLCLGAMCLYVYLLKKIGFFFDTLWLSAATMLILGYRKYWAIALSAVLITGAVFGVFYFLMHVPLPTVLL